MASYKVTKGDTLSQIAKAKGVTLQALLAANPDIKNACGHFGHPDQFRPL